MSLLKRAENSAIYISNHQSVNVRLTDDGPLSSFQGRSLVLQDLNFTEVYHNNDLSFHVSACVCVCDTGVTFFILYNILGMENLHRYTDLIPACPWFANCWHCHSYAHFTTHMTSPRCDVKVICDYDKLLQNQNRNNLELCSAHQWNGVGVAPQVFCGFFCWLL